MPIPFPLPKSLLGHDARWSLVVSSDGPHQEQTTWNRFPLRISISAVVFLAVPLICDRVMRLQTASTSHKLISGDHLRFSRYAAVLHIHGDGNTTAREKTHERSDTFPQTSNATTQLSTTFAPSELTEKGGPCYFEFNGGSKAMCFCQLAGNPGCAGKVWACGSTGPESRLNRSVTFKNIAKAHGCANPTALLTIPTSYFVHIQSLISWCPIGAAPLLTEMSREGFLNYQTLVSPGVVRQCIHAGWHASVPWLHIHTVCASGVIDQMSQTGHAAFCQTMSSSEEAATQAARIVAWAGGLKQVGNDSTVLISSKCSQRGCGISGPANHCSCSWDCPTFKDCCVDYEDVCLHACKEMGCGKVVSGSNCSCSDTCESNGKCCEDYKAACRAALKPSPAPAPLLPSACTDMGCGEHVIGAPCSCDDECEKHDACCQDYSKKCLLPKREPAAKEVATCRDMGCGKHVSGKSCACNDRCKEFNDCCEDYTVTCLKSCSDFGCGTFVKGAQCSCNAKCNTFSDCCEDYNRTCSTHVSGPPAINLE